MHINNWLFTIIDHLFYQIISYLFVLCFYFYLLCISFMNQLHKVYLLRHRSNVILVTSNLKTAYDWMIAEVPPFLHKHFLGYHSVNRKLKDTDTVEFPIPDRDWYYIERRKVYNNFKRDWPSSAGVQPGWLRPIDRCGNQLLRGWPRLPPFFLFCKYGNAGIELSGDLCHIFSKN